MDCSPPGSCLWNFPGKNTGVGCHFLLQGIFPTQGLNSVSCIAGGFFTIWAAREAPFMPTQSFKHRNNSHEKFRIKLFFKKQQQQKPKPRSDNTVSTFPHSSTRLELRLVLGGTWLLTDTVTPYYKPKSINTYFCSLFFDSVVSSTLFPPGSCRAYY